MIENIKIETLVYVIRKPLQQNWSIWHEKPKIFVPDLRAKTLPANVKVYKSNKYFRNGVAHFFLNLKMQKFIHKNKVSFRSENILYVKKKL